jgi:hypothetical protein
VDKIKSAVTKTSKEKVKIIKKKCMALTECGRVEVSTVMCGSRKTLVPRDDWTDPGCCCC